MILSFESFYNLVCKRKKLQRSILDVQVSRVGLTTLTGERLPEKMIIEKFLLFDFWAAGFFLSSVLCALNIAFASSKENVNPLHVSTIQVHMRVIEKSYFY